MQPTIIPLSLNIAAPLLAGPENLVMLSASDVLADPNGPGTFVTALDAYTECFKVAGVEGWLIKALGDASSDLRGSGISERDFARVISNLAFDLSHVPRSLIARVAGATRLSLFGGLDTVAQASGILYGKGVTSAKPVRMKIGKSDEIAPETIDDAIARVKLAVQKGVEAFKETNGGYFIKVSLENGINILIENSRSTMKVNVEVNGQLLNRGFWRISPLMRGMLNEFIFGSDREKLEELASQIGGPIHSLSGNIMNAIIFGTENEAFKIELWNLFATKYQVSAPDGQKLNYEEWLRLFLEAYAPIFNFSLPA